MRNAAETDAKGDAGAKAFALIGHPLGHSLSREIHDAILAAAGIDGVYEMIDVAPADLPARMPELLALDGFNATIPHKKAILPFLSGLSDAARRCGAANTVFEGRGYNTDVAGFRAAGLPLEGARVLLLGTGGVAAMMAAESLAAGAASLAVASRDAAKGEAFRAELLARVPDARGAVSVAASPEAKAAALAEATILLNGTPVGMWPKAGGIPVDPAALHPGLSVFDPVYCPTPSRLVLNARKAGARAFGGLPMLVRQAVAAQRIWNPGLALDEDALEARLLPALAAELWRKNATKIVLTGFMGAGKSTVGRALAARLGLPFADLDDEIAAAAGAPIPSIFSARGEEGFRALETDAARRVLARPGSEVVASGGGFPTFEANRALVRESNALVLLVDAPFETLWARLAGGDGRPLAREREETAALYERRAPIYRAFCDFAVPTSNDAPPESVAAALAAALAPDAPGDRASAPSSPRTVRAASNPTKGTRT